MHYLVRGFLFSGRLLHLKGYDVYLVFFSHPLRERFEGRGIRGKGHKEKTPVVWTSDVSPILLSYVGDLFVFTR